MSSDETQNENNESALTLIADTPGAFFGCILAGDLRARTTALGSRVGSPLVGRPIQLVADGGQLRSRQHIAHTIGYGGSRQKPPPTIASYSPSGRSSVGGGGVPGERLAGTARSKTSQALEVLRVNDANGGDRHRSDGHGITPIFRRSTCGGPFPAPKRPFLREGNRFAGRIRLR